MLLCDTIQERIARDEPLEDAAGRHVAACAACAAVLATWSALDADLRADAGKDAVVPDGFADRVMAALPPQPATRPPLLDRPWFQLALVNAGALAGAVNLLRLLFSALVPNTSLGGTP